MVVTCNRKQKTVVETYLNAEVVIGLSSIVQQLMSWPFVEGLSCPGHTRWGSFMNGFWCSAILCRCFVLEISGDGVI